jgi:plastocyanin
MDTRILYAGVIAAILATSLAITGPVFNAAMADHHENGTSTAGSGDKLGILNGTGTAADDNRVAVGGGNLTVQNYKFDPAIVEINTGESVTWYSPTEFNELHTVTFVQNPSLMSDIILPFSIEDTSDLKVLPPFNVGEPITMEMPNGTAIVALNKVAWTPSVTDSTGTSVQYLNGSTIEYTMNGTEGIINSGLIQQPFPEETTTVSNTTEVPPGGNTTVMEEIPEEGPPVGPPFPFVNEFTMTFEEPGTYDYFCALHPWMFGQVVVSGSNQTSTTVALQ